MTLALILTVTLALTLMHGDTGPNPDFSTGVLVRVGQMAERGVGGVGHHELVSAEGVHLRGADQAQTVARAHAWGDKQVT